ncbi:MAG: hypothetical protein Q8K79_01995 [Solirubrobacteraceae bacterium]|nr:hypothetical protein [Solirubrobacteraceae bacterium]
MAPEDARRLLTARRWARVRRDGVHHGGLAYTAVELTELVGATTSSWPSHRTTNERSRSTGAGAWLCTAHPHDALSTSEQEQILAERRRFSGELRRRQRHARGQAKSRLAPATSEQPTPADVIRLPPAQGHHVNEARAAMRRCAPPRAPIC